MEYLESQVSVLLSWLTCGATRDLLFIGAGVEGGGQSSVCVFNYGFDPQMEVQAPPGTTIGYVKQDWHPFVPRFSIQGANKETVMKLEGPCFACNCCGDVNFEVCSEDCYVCGLKSECFDSIYRFICCLQTYINILG